MPAVHVPIAPTPPPPPRLSLASRIQGQMLPRGQRKEEILGASRELRRREIEIYGDRRGKGGVPFAWELLVDLLYTFVAS